MNENVDRLYELLPVVYRQRDADQGWPLRALLRVIEEQVDLVEADIDQLYENWFIGTCQDWVVPYIGDLVGYRAVHSAGQPLTETGRQPNTILVPRREVANTIHYRRRKGTLALLETLAWQVAGWQHARAVEFYRLLAWTQAVKHRRLDRGRSADMHDVDTLDNLHGPFDNTAHTVDVRRVDARHQPGRYNLTDIGLYVWRLKSVSVTRAQSYCMERISAQRYTFSVLGNDMPLYTAPDTGRISPDAPDELFFPAPIRRHDLERHKKYYYGPDKSLQIWTGFPLEPIPENSIVAADLSDWGRYQPRDDQVAVDPELGRILFRSRRASKEKVWVTYHRGLCAEIGGGEYERSFDPLGTMNRYPVSLHSQDPSVFRTISAAIQRWETDGKPDAVIEILDSGVYSEQIGIELPAGRTLEIRAANCAWPVIRQLDYQPSLPDALSVCGDDGSSFTLDGVLVTGRPLRVTGALRHLNLRHVTLVPGWTIHANGEPDQANEFSLQLNDTTGTRVNIAHSIVGSIQVYLNEVTTDPIPIHISDSIIDATQSDFKALDAPDWPLAHTALTIERCTVVGAVDAHAIELAKNSIFTGRVRVGRSQLGCMRFCYVPSESRTPRRFRCQPDLVLQEIENDESAAERAETRVRPRFSSLRYGTPTYARLADRCAEEIRRGADDESEMGVFHDLFEPQRAANLEARLDEYVPAGMDVGIIFAS